LVNAGDMPLRTGAGFTGMLIVYVADCTALLAQPGTVANASRVSDDDTVMGPLYIAELAVGVVPLVV
jgi:hypothetical protein